MKPLLAILYLPLLLSLLSLSHCDIPACNSHDEAVLLQIKSHFKGVGLSDWDPNNSCCYWDYVGCGGEGEYYGRVTAVTIPGGRGLSGTIPDVIGNLPYLQEIMFLEEPKLVGPIPKSFSKLKKLQLIYLNSNNLSGKIPGFLGQLKELREIDISGNLFSGSIPPSLSHLRQLTQLKVSQNMLTGAIPALSTRKLKGLDVSHNQLCGAIPSQLKKFGVSSFQDNKCLCGAPLPPCH